MKTTTVVVSTLAAAVLAPVLSTSVLSTSVASAATPAVTTAALSTTATRIAALAEANVGRKACSKNSLGGTAFETSCTGNGGQPEYWCSDFASWVWANAGVADTGTLDAAAGSFYLYGLDHGTLTATPAVGDAAVFDYEGGGYADHVAIVTGVSADGKVTTVSGDWGGTGSTEAGFSSTSSVVLNAPAYTGAIGAVPSIMGMTLSGFVAPVGGGVTPVVGETTIAAGHTMEAGQSVTSPNSLFKLEMLSNGELVEYLGTRPVWSSPTSGHSGADAVMQTDGNLVVYSSAGKALWWSGTSGHAGSTLVLRNNGGLSVLDGSTALWTFSPSPSHLPLGVTLPTGGYVVSTNGLYRLTMQADGNLVETTAGRALWSTRTSSAGARAVMQTDGNLVVYSSADKALWESVTSGHPGASLLLQTSGAAEVMSGTTVLFSDGV